MMELLRGRSRWSTLLFLLTLASVAATETLPRQVLLLYSYEREFAPHVAFAKQFLPELSRTSTEPVDFIEVSLQPVRVSRSAPDDSMMNYVRAMLAGRQPDLVVPIGGPATAFAQRNRQQLFPGAPTPTQLLAAPVFDWRELRRWNIDEQGLPPRSQVMFASQHCGNDTRARS